MARLTLQTETIASATSPATGKVALIPDTTGDLYFVNDAGEKLRVAFEKDPVTVTANYSADAEDRFILADSTSGILTVTLNHAAARKGEVVVKRVAGANNVVVTDSVTFDGAASVTLSTLYETVRLLKGSAEWHRIE